MKYLVYIEEFYVEADNEDDAREEALSVLSWTGNAEIRVQPVEK